MNDYANIGKIEDFFWKLFEGELFKNKYLTELPSTNEFESAVVIDIPNPISDMDAYAKGTVLIYVYAKPLSPGFKNPIIGKTENEIFRIVEECRDTRYTISRRNTYTDYDAGRDLHVSIIELNLLIG